MLSPNPPCSCTERAEAHQAVAIVSSKLSSSSSGSSTKYQQESLIVHRATKRGAKALGHSPPCYKSRW